MNSISSRLVSLIPIFDSWEMLLPTLQWENYANQACIDSSFRWHVARSQHITICAQGNPDDKGYEWHTDGKDPHGIVTKVPIQSGNALKRETIEAAIVSALPGYYLEIPR